MNLELKVSLIDLILAGGKLRIGPMSKAASHSEQFHTRGTIG
jgi:hypothetical protein